MRPRESRWSPLRAPHGPRAASSQLHTRRSDIAESKAHPSLSAHPDSAVRLERKRPTPRKGPVLGISDLGRDIARLNSCTELRHEQVSVERRSGQASLPEVERSVLLGTAPIRDSRAPRIPGALQEGLAASQLSPAQGRGLSLQASSALRRLPPRSDPGDRVRVRRRCRHVIRECPTTMLFWATFTQGDAEEFAPQARQLLAQLRSMPRRSPSWHKVSGVLWLLEPARGANGRWRSHLHCLVAVDLADAHGHHRRLAMAWARAAWADQHPDDPVPTSKRSERAFRRLAARQDTRPLRCYSLAALLSPRLVPYSEPELAGDVLRLCEYAGMRKDARSGAGGFRTTPMSATDHAEVDVSRRNLRGCTGVFRAVPRDGREALVQALRDAVPNTAEVSIPAPSSDQC